MSEHKSGAVGRAFHIAVVERMGREIAALKAQRDELLAAAKAYQELSVCYRLNKRPTEKLFDRLETANFAIANVEATSCD
ncbi:MAG TPA: hypothetical protein PLW80_11590 [Spirochaetales bacterium]|nr:hypothetical protein [Spirochaetales bacterium]